MKSKIKRYFIIGVAIIVLALVIGATWYIKGKIDLNNFNEERIRTNEQHRQEVAEAMSQIIPIEVDVAYYDSVDAVIANLMKINFDLSHQDPEMNDEYDQQVDEYWHYLPDPVPPMIEILPEVGKVDSTYFEYEDPFYEYGVNFMAFYCHPYQDKDAYWFFKFGKPTRKIAQEYKYSVGGYITYNGLAGTFGHKLFNRIEINTMITGNKIMIDGNDHFYITPWLGVKYEF